MYVERSIHREFLSASKLTNIVAIVGPRQAGKTTFLKEQHGAAGYLLFDDPDIREMFDEDVKKFESQYLKGNAPVVLDEVQNGKDAGRKLKYLADTGKRLWVTSSSQTMLGKDVLGWLVGRVSVLTLYPFSFAEFLTAKGQRQLTPSIASRLMEEHMLYGGYPKVVLEGDAQNKEMLLKDLYKTMVLRDVARTFSINDADAIERLAVYLSHSTGSAVVYNNICRDLGLSFQSVKKYLDAMEKSYIIARAMPFYKNRFKEITKQPKIYFLDTGLRNAVANDFVIGAESAGKLFENYLFSELLKSGFDVKFWQSKSRAEVDFIIRKGPEIIPIEVKLKAEGQHVERSLHSFIESYKPKRAFVVFKSGDMASKSVGRCTVNFTDPTGLLKALGGTKRHSASRLS